MMSQYDPIFMEYRDLGFQDIWLKALSDEEIATVFNNACNLYSSANCAAISVDELGISEGRQLTFINMDYLFEPLLVCGTPLEGVRIRIEDDQLAIDFNPGLDYWTDERQTAFFTWLKELCQVVPHVRLEWAHEGGVETPSESQSFLLRQAVTVCW